MSSDGCHLNLFSPVCKISSWQWIQCDLAAVLCTCDHKFFWIPVYTLCATGFYAHVLIWHNDIQPPCQLVTVQTIVNVSDWTKDNLNWFTLDLIVVI